MPETTVWPTEPQLVQICPWGKHWVTIRSEDNYPCPDCSLQRWTLSVRWVLCSQHSGKLSEAWLRDSIGVRWDPAQGSHSESQKHWAPRVSSRQQAAATRPALGQRDVWFKCGSENHQRDTGHGLWSRFGDQGMWQYMAPRGMWNEGQEAFSGGTGTFWSDWYI